jgi:hypothetical protein
MTSPAWAGVVAVLMEEDNVTDAGAVAGYNALVDAIRSGLTKLTGTLGLTKQEVTDQDIDSIETEAAKAVKAAIKSNQNLFENLWAWLNKDDQIGSEVFRFSHDKLAEGTVINFSKRWKNEGDWQIFGHANASVLCPAEAIGPAKAILGAVFGRAQMESMRRFRDDRFPRERGLAEWWQLAERNSAELAWLFQTDGEAAERLRRLAPIAVEILSHPEERIPEDLLQDVGHILEAAARSPSRRLRIDARRARSFLELARGRSFAEAIQIADRLPPARGVGSQTVAAVVQDKAVMQTRKGAKR